MFERGWRRTSGDGGTRTRVDDVSASSTPLHQSGGNNKRLLQPRDTVQRTGITLDGAVGGEGRAGGGGRGSYHGLFSRSASAAPTAERRRVLL